MVDSETVHRIFRKIEEQGEMLTRIDERTRKIEEHEHILRGENGGSDRPGLVVRVDRVDRITTALVWIVGVFVSASVVALVGIAFTHIAGR